MNLEMEEKRALVTIDGGHRICDRGNAGTGRGFGYCQRTHAEACGPRTGEPEQGWVLRSIL